MSIRPLQLLLNSYIRDIVPKPAEKAVDETEKAILNYIDGRSTFDECKFICEEYLGTNTPLLKIQSILSVKQEPLPPTQMNFFSRTKNGRKLTYHWTEEEDNRLLHAINCYGINEWQKVAEFVGNNRNKAQCSQRWFRVLDPRIKKCQWTKEEEEELLKLVGIYGDKNWKILTMKIQGRSDTQCRYHYSMMKKEKKSPSKHKSEKKEPSFTSGPENFSLWDQFNSFISPSTAGFFEDF